MPKKDARNTKGRIVDAAWALFYEQGYEGTTIEDIVERSETSKGSFYHYFNSKDAILSSLSYLFDAKYEQLMEEIPPEMNSFDKLIYLNHALFLMIENSVPMDLLAQMYSSQLVTYGDRHLLNQSRTYYRVLRKIVAEGQSRGQLRTDFSSNEIVKAYALLERAMIYDWCICNGDYSLYQYSDKALPLFLSAYRCDKSVDAP